KTFVDRENAYAFTILPELCAIKPSPKASSAITTIDEFEELSNNNWRASHASAIVEAFEKVKDVCVAHNINLSDKRFDRLVDGLMDHCEKLTDHELLKLLHLFSEYPSCDNISSHNFHDVWSCLDDICCWKMGAWNVETMFTFANAWYKLNMGRICDYVFEMLDKMPQKAKRLSKTLLLYTFFHTNVCRKRSMDFELEHALAERINQFSVDELAVIAMGYFKTQSKVKLYPILSAMIKKVTENCDTIHEICLTAILKTIRLSQHLETVDEINLMLDKLTEQVPRLSNLCLVHLALAGTSLQLKHEASLARSTERIVADIENIRLKDIERLLHANSMFNFESKPSFYEAAFAELHKESRREEIIRYNRCLPCALNYLSLRKIYSYKLMDEVLNEEYIHEVYGKTAKQLPRELFSLDACIDIECPDYEGNRLTPLKKYKAAKWLTEYTPSHNQWKRLSLADKFYLDVVEHVMRVAGGEHLLRSHHVLPHFSKSDVIVCKDRASGRFVEPFGFENYVLGDVMWPFSVEKYQWYAVVILTPNLTIRSTTSPLGSMVMKERQLKTLGYTPI
ncbi:FAST kinase domain-containing protein 5, partial [Asbolus verrucosus]